MLKRPKDFCKDCWDEWLKSTDSGLDGPTKQRPAPYPGPRCATHNRAVKKERSKRTAEKRDENVYGLKPGGFEALLEVQGGKCAICQRATGKTRRLSVDHDHTTGWVRGALCRPCNTLIGRARDSVDFFLRAADYLKNPPADKLPNEYFSYKDQDNAPEEQGTSL